MGLGYVEQLTHNYRRYATLMAALDTGNGKVLRNIARGTGISARTWRCTSSSTTTPRTNISASNDGSPQGDDFTCTPTYASWLNQVELWFNRTTQQAIRRGTFRSV